MASRLVLALVLLASTLSAQGRPPADSFYQAIRNDDLVALAALARTHGTAVTDAQEQTPLIVAAAFGSLEAVRLLVDAGAGINAASTAGLTALHLAAGDVRKVQLLVDRGAAIDVPSKLGRTPLLVAASSQGATAVVQLLLDRGANINHADQQGLTALIAAASVDDSATVKLLLQRGADPAVRAPAVPQSATALMATAYNGNEEVTRLLLARKPDVHVRSSAQGQPVRNGNVQFADVTALHMAVTGANPNVVSLLLNAGAAPDALDVRGMTPLMWAVATDRPNMRIVRLLLERGADVSIRSKADETAADWARKFNDPEVLAALKLPKSDARANAVRPVAAHVADASRAAVLRSMPLLREASDNMLPRGGCVACHAQPMMALAAQLAAGRGWAVEEQRADVEGALATMAANAPVFLQSREAGGLMDSALYVSLMFAAQKLPPVPATDTFVNYLSTKQRPSGQWHGVGATRAPIQDGDVSRTAMRDPHADHVCHSGTARRIRITRGPRRRMAGRAVSTLDRRSRDAAARVEMGRDARAGSDEANARARCRPTRRRRLGADALPGQRCVCDRTGAVRASRDRPAGERPCPAARRRLPPADTERRWLVVREEPGNEDPAVLRKRLPPRPRSVDIAVRHCVGGNGTDGRSALAGAVPRVPGVPRVRLARNDRSPVRFPALRR